MSILDNVPSLEEEYVPTGDNDDVWVEPEEDDLRAIEEEFGSGELGDYQDEGFYLDSDYPNEYSEYELSDPYDIEYDRP